MKSKHDGWTPEEQVETQEQITQGLEAECQTRNLFAEARGSETLAVGEVVRATKWITRKDNRCALPTGKTATVTSVWKGSRPGVQIVAVRLADGNQMIDIVVENGVPLVRAESQNGELADETRASRAPETK